MGRPLSRGFTIIELIIVVVVIAVLAAIVIVAYNGVTNQAIEASMKSDIRNAMSALDKDKIKTRNYPLSASAANEGLGLKASGDNVLTYQSTGNEFCVSVSNPRAAMPLRVRSTDNKVVEGSCEAVVSTFTGSTVGYADGTGTAARFNGPYGIATDASGTSYIADYSNQRIRKVTADGVVSTFAGSGTNGYLDGAGTTARFSGPIDVAVDTTGNVYVAESVGQRIRKITSAGVVSTLAGSGVNGYADGTGTAAQFSSPAGIAVDSSGNVYVSDYGNQRIRKITPAGVVTTFAGSSAGYLDGTGTAARFTNPRGIAIDSSDTLYVADYSNYRIRKITSAGVVTTFAGSSAGYLDGTGTAARFNRPYGVAVDASGILYVTDNTNRRVRKITPAGVVTTLAGTGVSGATNGVGTVAEFASPGGVSIDASGTVLYVTEYSNHRIRKIEL